MQKYTWPLATKIFFITPGEVTYVLQCLFGEVLHYQIRLSISALQEDDVACKFLKFTVDSKGRVSQAREEDVSIFFFFFLSIEEELIFVFLWSSHPHN